MQISSRRPYTPAWIARLARRPTIDTSDAERWCTRLAQPYRRRKSCAVAMVATLDDAVFVPFGDDATLAASPGPDTLFEIGSLTKVFTAILLAKLSLDGRIDLDAPIAELLPEFAGAPASVTPRSLSTHTSGLPRLPFRLTDRRAWCFYFEESRLNPYPRFTNDDLIRWTRAYRPSGEAGAGRFAYSNLGVGILGYLLGRLGGESYEDASRRNIFDALGLADTRVTLTDEQNARFAPPRRRNGEPAPLWNFEGLAGAGALRSSARDLLRFGRAIIHAAREEGPLAATIHATQHVQIPARRPFEPDICLGWSRLPKLVSARPIYNHDGATFGSMSTFFVCPDAGFVIAVLANRGIGLATPLEQIRSDPAGLMREMTATIERR
jgi:CubicO group peptidase (beta-lactamase class C family)